MFKRLALATATAVTLSGAFIAPAAAATVNVEGEMCTFMLTDEEASLINSGANAQGGNKLTISRTDSAAEAETYRVAVESQEATLAHLKENPELNASTIPFTEKYLKITKSFAAAYKACAEGKDYPVVEVAPSPEPSTPSTKDEEGKKEDQAALSSPDGKPNEAGIGLIVGGVLLAVVAAAAAALPMLAPMLPAGLRDKLPF